MTTKLQHNCNCLWGDLRYYYVENGMQAENRRNAMSKMYTENGHEVDFIENAKSGALVRFMMTGEGY